MRLDVEEETVDEKRYALVVRSVGAKGEESQRIGAQRLKGKRIDVDLDDGAVTGTAEMFSGTQDLAAADIAMLFVLFAPVVPSPDVAEGDRWRTKTTPIAFPWAKSPLSFTVDHEAAGERVFEGLDAVRVKSNALANVTFPLPIVVPREGSAGQQADDFVINEVFDNLFADVDNPIEGFGAAIAAIPLAILAPFLAFGEALGDLFGGSGDDPEEPKIPVIDMAGGIELHSDTSIWRADGRVLEAVGSGEMSLAGRIPELPGAAAELSGKTLRLDVGWKMRRKHSSTLPEPRDPPGRGALPFIAGALLVVALALTAYRYPPRLFLGRRQSR